MRLFNLYTEAMSGVSDLGPYIVEIGYEEEDNIWRIRIIHQDVIKYWNDPVNASKDAGAASKFFQNRPDIIHRAEGELEQYGEYWTIHTQSVVSGWGPFICQLGIEYATTQGGVLVPASGVAKLFGYPMSDTPRAAKIWEQFYSRTDVQHHTIDSLTGLQPPWLYCSYTKQPTTIKQLSAAGKLSID